LKNNIICYTGSDILKYRVKKFSHTYIFDSWIGKLYFVNSNVGYAIQSYGGQNYGEVFRTTDGGENWTSLGEGSSTRGVYFKDNTNGYIFGDGFNGYQYSINSGATWSTSTAVNELISSINFPSINVGFVIDNVNNKLYKTTTNGSSFSNITFTGASISSIYMVNDTYGFIMSDSNVVYYTTNGGLNWTQKPFTHTQLLYEQFNRINDNMYYIGGGTNIMRVTLTCVDYYCDVEINLISYNDPEIEPYVDVIYTDINGDTITIGVDWIYNAGLSQFESTINLTGVRHYSVTYSGDSVSHTETYTNCAEI